nr:ribonuclease H [Ipomoea batatas]
MLLITDGEDSDDLVWRHSSNGKLSVSSAYANIHNFADIDEQYIWNKIWQLKLPNRIRAFLWVPVPEVVLSLEEDVLGFPQGRLCELDAAAADRTTQQSATAARLLPNPQPSPSNPSSVCDFLPTPVLQRLQQTIGPGSPEICRIAGRREPARPGFPVPRPASPFGQLLTSAVAEASGGQSGGRLGEYESRRRAEWSDSATPWRCVASGEGERSRLPELYERMVGQCDTRWPAGGGCSPQCEGGGAGVIVSSGNGHRETEVRSAVAAGLGRLRWTFCDLRNARDRGERFNALYGLEDAEKRLTFWKQEGDMLGATGPLERWFSFYFQAARLDRALVRGVATDLNIATVDHLRDYSSGSFTSLD